MKIAILDRDGTLNQIGEEGFIASAEAWKAQPGALEAVAQLNRAGWHVVVATNQPGLGRGLFDVTELNAIHARMHRELAAAGARIDAIFYCPHPPDEECSCRKPGPALFAQIAERFGAEGHQLRVIGSCVAHLQAGAAVGARLFLVCTGASAGLPVDGDLPAGLPPGTRRFPDLAALVDALLGETPPPAPRP
ncbi:D-glycero-alpha-D-manno-heptose-1,7-bisphosphate 7-phosphatase [Delftia sp. PS-11]|uniref:D-glycero-alpha-D-manno-heptose-1,7-bisphosphate 7-phosphatase n=1 Tax=Delftia sp. PS-11 TaxID=2767222 RepID=UPI002457079B|nr:HAD-IIIA family hydrolase [Delftia sp. PS-11]KAJ8745949.1 HAD-IIIA family hydrolase [Delftia sp. PS-11]